MVSLLFLDPAQISSKAGFWSHDDERDVQIVWIYELPKLSWESKKAPTEVGAFLLAAVPSSGIHVDRPGQKVRYQFIGVLLPYPNVEFSILLYN